MWAKIQKHKKFGSASTWYCTSWMLCSLCWGRWQVALRMLVTCLLLSFLEYLCPSTILHTCNHICMNKLHTACTIQVEVNGWWINTSIGKYTGRESLPDCRQGQEAYVLNNSLPCPIIINRKSNNIKPGISLEKNKLCSCYKTVNKHDNKMQVLKKMTKHYSQDSKIMCTSTFTHQFCWTLKDISQHWQYGYQRNIHWYLRNKPLKRIKMFLSHVHK